MQKTPDYIENKLNEFLSPLASEIGGQILRGETRTDGSKEDITSTCLDLSNDLVQLGGANVTIYCNDIAERETDKIAYIANLERFDILQKRVLELLGDEMGKHWKGGTLTVGNFGTKFRNKEDNQHFSTLNIRFRLYPFAE